jgi:hypothetical protein
VGGEFIWAGDVSAHYIAKWDGANWSPLGNGFNNICYSLLYHDNTLYAGGAFTQAGDVWTNYIAQWDGTQWSKVGTQSLSGHCNALAASESGEIYAGGWFGIISNEYFNHIAKWDGNTWTMLGTGLNDYCYAIATSGNQVYAGGWFTAASENDAHYIATWGEPVVASGEPVVSDPEERSVFPNPGKPGLFRINYLSAVVEEIHIITIDMSGQVLTAQNYRVNAGSQLLEVDLSGVPAGVYTLHISGNSNFISQVIVVE